MKKTIDAYFALFFVLFFATLANSLELKSLCNERISKNETHLVNSYYRIKLNKTLPSINYYLNESINNILIQKTSYAKLIKNLFNQIYSENFVNATKLMIKIQEKESQLSEIKSEIESRYQDRLYSGDYLDHRIAFYSDINKINFLLGNLTKFEENFLTKTILNMDDLRLHLNKLNNLTKDQKSTFKNEFIDIFYDLPLVKLDGFRIESKNSIYTDYSTSGTLFFSLYVPFYDKTQSNVKSNCSCSDYLPKFYTVETVPVQKNQTEQNEN